jgi:ParB family transcriptional regulator, chromosome partitioning protein
MSKRRGLGSGLDALIPSASPAEGSSVRQLAVESIRGNRSQPRTQFDEAALDELAASIREHGVIQPIIVSEENPGSYELIAGERRWRAAQRAGLRTIPALVKSANSQQLLELALVENVQRADLNPIEEGVAYQTLKDEFGLSDEQIGQRVGKSRVTVVNTRRLIRLVPEARQALLAGELSAGHGRALLRFEHPADQELALQLVLRRELSVREAERLAEVAQHQGLAPTVRAALLGGSLSIVQAHALLRVEDGEQQVEAMELLRTRGLSSRDSERLVEAIGNGATVAQALAQLAVQAGDERPRQSGLQQQATTDARRSEREQSAEDAEIQRLFEERLGTPVQLLRSAGNIRLTVTMYSEEQLQQLYDRLVLEP